jgi:hypothetical protein
MIRRIPGMCVAALVAALACTSCIRNFYVLDLQPTRDGLQRRLTIEGRVTSDSVTRPTHPNLEDEEFSRLARAYGTRPVRAAERPFVFQRAFPLDMPNDIGGKGSCKRTKSLLGETRVYFERFRGDADPAGTLAAQFGAMDSLCDLLIGWTEAELGRDPRYPALRSFLGGKLRSDFRNLALDLWLAASGPAGSYRDLPEERFQELAGSEWAQAVMDSLQPDSSGTRRKGTLALRRLFASGMGIRDERVTARALPFLASPESAGRSLGRYLADSTPGGGTPRDPDEVLGDFLRRGIGFSLDGLGSNEDSLTVRLTLPVPPVESNGTWDPATGAVRWGGTLVTPTRRDLRLPMVCYAKWSVPDSVRQRLLFGRVLLRQARLADYCSWYEKLSPWRAGAWNRMLMTLKPGDLSPLARFRFADERGKPGAPPDSSAASRADPARELILSAAGQEP